MPYKDISKARAARLRWYYKNTKKARSDIDARKEEIRLWFADLKSKLRCSCGENHPATLDFHHKDPKEKDFHLSVAVHDGWSKAKILAEIEKCIVLCSNCHRKLHWAEHSPLV